MTPAMVRYVRAVARRVAGRHPRRQIHTDDLCQVGCVAVWQAGVTVPGGLAGTIAEREMVDYLRAWQRGLRAIPDNAVAARNVYAPASLDDSPGRVKALRATAGGDMASWVCARVDMQRALARLTAPQRLVIVATAAGRTLADVGRELGVTESRACQIRTVARRLLAAA